MQLRDQIGSRDFSYSNVFDEKAPVTAVAISADSRFVLYSIGDAVFRKEEEGFRANTPVQLCQNPNSGGIKEIFVTQAGTRMILNCEGAGLLVYELDG